MSCDEVAGLEEEREEAAAKRQAEYLARTLRALKLGLGKLWRRQSVTITEYDPSYKVAYLGNVLTGWAKGEGCTEKPVGTLWRNYCASARADVAMTVTVSAAGLRAVTREHGLTEYWSHRVTFCAAPPAFPRVFCWVYRHEGRRLKQELRCHAVLCTKASVARSMASQLQARLGEALREFRRDKLGRQQARLSLANAVYAQPSLPRRRILLSTGAANYRPPLERSKSAPKLGPIDEISEEESVVLDDEDDDCGREGGSLSSESGVVLAPSLPEEHPEVCGLPCATDPPLELPCATAPCTPLYDSDESGYDEEGGGLVRETRVSFRASGPPRPSSMKRKGSARKIRSQVSFKDEESSDDNAPTEISNGRISPVENVDDSLSENSFELSTYIPTHKYSQQKIKLPNLDCNNVNNYNSSDDLLTSVLQCMTGSENNNESPACKPQCAGLPPETEVTKMTPRKAPAPPTPAKRPPSPPVKHTLAGATVDSSYVEV